jgi:monoterpene epsilon-lactone hydrolase
MNTSQVERALEVPARRIPVPSSVSPQAQAVLAMGRWDLPEYPAVDDVAGWRTWQAHSDQVLVEMYAANTQGHGMHVEEVEAEGVRIFVLTPPTADPDDERVYFDVHGGGLVMGGGECCRGMAIQTATALGMKVWSPDYRMPPDHPYPAALDDCVGAYRALLAEHPIHRVVVGGGSAGGNLAAALILRARDEGLPLPTAAVLLSPEVDLTESGDSFSTNMGVDTVLVRSLMPANLVYAAGHDLTDPYVSPLFGDFSKGFPPTFLSAGTRDLFLSNAVRMHRALRGAGVPADLHIFEATPHGGFMSDTPESRDLDGETRRFIDIHCPA